MDTKKILALLTAIERGSLTAAAAELGYTQSGLTHMMNSLETELGLNLLVRSKSGVHLSPAGQELLPQMKALMDAAEQLEQSAARLCLRNFSTLRLGVYSSVARQWLPGILAEYRRVSPDTEVNIYVGGMVEIYDMLKNDQLDCAIVSYNEAMCQGLNFIPLRNDPLTAILPGDYPLASAAFPIVNFNDAEFLMPSAGFDLDINPIFNLDAGRVTPRVRYTNLADGAIVSMVEHHLGVSILSDLVMQDMSENVLSVPLDPPAFRQLGIAVGDRQQSDKNIRRFTACAQSLVSQIYPEEPLG